LKTVGYDLAYALSAKPSLPVSRGSNDMLLTAVLLTQDLRYASPSQFPSDATWSFAPLYSGGTVLAFHQASLLSLAAPVRRI